jgi:hypothetical protein
MKNRLLQSTSSLSCTLRVHAAQSLVRRSHVKLRAAPRAACALLTLDLRRVGSYCIPTCTCVRHAQSEANQSNALVRDSTARTAWSGNPSVKCSLMCGSRTAPEIQGSRRSECSPMLRFTALHILYEHGGVPCRPEERVARWRRSESSRERSRHLSPLMHIEHPNIYLNLSDRFMMPSGWEPLGSSQCVHTT